MASVLADHMEIKVVKTVSGNTPKTVSINEKASQTFFKGVPVMLNTGVIQEWDATVGSATATRGIAGIAGSPGANLASDGLGAPTAFGSVGGTGAIQTYGNVPYQTGAVNIAFGTPFTDGRTILEMANSDTFFIAQFDDAGGTPANAVTAQSMIGKHFGLTKDATGHWYVDFAKVTIGTNTCVVIEALDPIDGARQNGRVYFRFEKGICQLDAN